MKKIVVLFAALMAHFAVASDVDLYKGLLFWIKDQKNIEGNEERQISLPLSTVLDGSKAITFSGADIPKRDTSAFSFAVSFKTGSLNCINRLFQLGSSPRHFYLDAENKLHYDISGYLRTVNWKAEKANTWYTIVVAHEAGANTAGILKIYAGMKDSKLVKVHSQSEGPILNCSNNQSIASNFKLGQTDFPSSGYLTSGQFANVRFWTRALTDEECELADEMEECEIADEMVNEIPQIKNVKAMQQYPWANKVYISYEVEGDVDATRDLVVVARDKDLGRTYEASPLLVSGDTGMAAGLHKIVWDIGAQGVSINSTNVTFSVIYAAEYMVVDLSGGANASCYPISYLSSVPSIGWSDTYKTTKLVLRRIPAGTYKMQNTSNVTLTTPFYIGVFEVTQKQYELVMGKNPSGYTGDMRPVEKVSYNTIRGSSNGAKWPSSSSVDSDSFMGKLRIRTGLLFDLPTEACWEYACRAGTTSVYNNGGNSESDLKKLGRYSGNTADGKGGYSQHTTVGSYLPNDWGLYDMHGKVWELCLDWYGALTYGKDPQGSISGEERSNRGGGYLVDASACTSTRRDDYPPASCHTVVGFRLACTLTY